MQYEKYRDKIERLSLAAFGPGGECPEHVHSIDDLPITSKRTTINDDPRSYYDVSVSIDVAEYDTDRIRYMQENPVRLDGRCLMAGSVSLPAFGGLASPCVSIDFKQIVAPR